MSNMSGEDAARNAKHRTYWYTMCKSYRQLRYRCTEASMGNHRARGCIERVSPDTQIDANQSPIQPRARTTSRSISGETTNN